MEVARQWRRDGANRVQAFSMPQQAADLWSQGLITQAQALAPSFWKTELYLRLVREMEEGILYEVAVIMHSFAQPKAE